MLIVQKLVAIVCSFILWFCGPEIDSRLLDCVDKAVNNKERYVLIFPHSSLLESFWLMILCNSFWDRKKCLVGRGCCFYRYFQWPIIGSLLRYTRVIPVQQKHSGGPGGATNIIGDLIEQDCEKEDVGVIFCISPQGSTKARSWQSGYYHLARRWNAKVIVGGYDFISHRYLALNELINVLDLSTTSVYHDLEEQYVREFLEIKFVTIVPLHPDQSTPHCVPKRSRKDTTLLSWKRIAVKVLILLILQICISKFVVMNIGW